MKKCSIMIAIHKPCNWCKKPGYVPIQVGAEINGELGLNIQKDNTGDNISNMNNIYCELTGLYWMWKNYELNELAGLVHYRRYYIKNIFSIFKKDWGILDEQDINNIFESGKKIVFPRRLKKLPDNGRLYEDGRDNQDKPLLLLESIIQKDYPEYNDSFHEVAYGNYASFGNIFILEKEMFNNYCEWVFDILGKYAKEVEEVPPRFLGYLSEYLLDVWVRKNYSSDQIKYMDIVNTDHSKLGNFLVILKRRIFI